MNETDLADVLKIQACCYTELVPESLRAFRAKWMASASTCFVASINGDVVGYLVSLPWDDSAPPELDAPTCRLPVSPTCLYLHDLAVLPSARKAGAGALLIDAFFGAIDRLGLQCARLIAVQDSSSYWQRFGFSELDVTGNFQAKLSTYGSRVRFMQRVIRLGQDGALRGS